ncbi:MAG: MFS transporter [Halioglobus sp.]|nr:MFS transporter [Halioglobus sp.]
MPSSFRTVWLLAAIYAIAICAQPMMMLIGSIIGARLAPSEQWATLPITLMIVGIACGVVPAVRGMRVLGRRATFALFIAVGGGACALAAVALARESFALFCLAAFFLGNNAAALHQIRFAAMESVALEQAPTAASIIMCSGIVAAFIGPELALAGKDLAAVEYAGSFGLGALCLLAGALLLRFYRPAPLAQHERVKSGRKPAALLRDRTIVLAIVSGACGYVVMSFVMTATPISMHLHHGHSLEDTKWVIQSHIAAMFLPSLLTPWLFRLLGIRGLMALGLACYAVTIAIGLVDVSVLGFWGQLVMLGIGWNFLFVSGTALLPTAYREGEALRAQALNDSVLFSSQALASLSAGWAMSLVSWQALLSLCAVPMVFMAALLAAGGWRASPARG